MTESDVNNELSSVEALLAKRNELDIKIHRDHTKNVTVFFCDIKGYTSYTETHGDLASRALCKQMTDIAFPAIEEFEGHLVKTIGDAVMAYFSDPEKGVRFAIALAQRLKADNDSRPAVKRVTLRIGMHCGEAIVDAGDLYGDSVNIAARIEPHAKPNGILISPFLFQEVQDIQDITCVYAKEIMMKGKAEPIKLYQVVWDGERQDDYSEDEQPRNGDDKSKMSGGPTPLEKKGMGKFTKLAVALALIVVVVFLKMYSQNGSSPGDKSLAKKISTAALDLYASGYAALRKGDIPKATDLFKKINQQDPAYQETLAALSYWQDDFDGASRLNTEALATGGDRVYPHVIDGNLKLRQKKYKEASTAFQEGLEQGKGLKWQKARAYNGLARVSVANGDLEQALGHYLKAVSFEPDDSEILTNQGVLLEKLNRGDEAAAVYQKAVSVNPQDELAKQRLHMSQQREKIKLDSAKQDRINKLVEDLAAQFSNTDASGAKETAPYEQPTIPLITWLLGFEEKGDVPKREGEGEVFAELLTQSLQGAGVVEFVERALLDKLLAELKLGSSELVDQNTSLRLGRLLAAKILINGSIFRKSGQTFVNVKVVEIETSRIRATASIVIPKGEGLFSSVEAVSKKISQKIQSVYDGGQGRTL